MSNRKITFVAAVNNRGVLESNLLASPCFRVPHNHQILIQEGFTSAGAAYNDAIARSHNDLIVFVHQDILFPEEWLNQLETALDWLEKEDSAWGVLGCYGETQNDRGRGQVYQSGMGVIGTPIDRPSPVQTLDEIVLILRKSSELKFDDLLPHFHLYGTDICLRAEQAGRKSYAIPAFCIHNTNQTFLLPKEFYECYHYVKRAWRSQLPVQASCMRITKWNLELYKRRMYEIYFRYTRHRNTVAPRVQDVRQLVRDAETKIQKRAASNCAV